MLSMLKAYLAGLAVVGALDLLWVGVLARPFYQARVGHLMGDVRWLGAVLFYALYPAGVLYFAGKPGLSRAALDGAFLGLVVYGTYNFTNLALLRGWPLSVCAVDIAWGCALTAAAACAQSAARY